MQEVTFPKEGYNPIEDVAVGYDYDEAETQRRRDGRKTLGWTDTTSYVDRVQDVQLLSATGHDFKFVSIHHDIRELIDAKNKEPNLQGFDYDRFYARISMIASGNSEKAIELNKVDEEGRATGESVDLFKLAYFNRVKEVNQYLPDEHRFSEEELKRSVFADEPLLCNFIDPKNGKQLTFDLRDKVPQIDISADDFQYYLKTIEESQVQFQMLSNFRDRAIQIHHGENAGHCQMKKIAGKNTYVPVSVEDAKNYVRADVRKMNSSFRAKGYSHEIGWYEENTSTLVKIEADAYFDWRKDIDTSRVHEQSDPRMTANLVGLASGESYISTDKQRKSFHFGNGGTGKIYAAMRHHYNKKMESIGREGITNQEIGDKIVTDIVGVAYAINPHDWLMSFAKNTGLATQQDIIREEMIKDKGEKGKPVFIFDAKRIKGHSEKYGNEPIDATGKEIEYGRVFLEGIPALTQYIQWRISLGDVPGIDASKKLDVNGISKEQEDEIDRLREAEEEADEEDKDLLGLTETLLDQLGGLMENIFGDQARPFLQSLIDGKRLSQIVFTTEAGAQEAHRIESDEELLRFVESRLEKARVPADVLISFGRTANKYDTAKALVDYIKSMSGKPGISKRTFIDPETGEKQVKKVRIKDNNAQRLLDRLGSKSNK